MAADELQDLREQVRQLTSRVWELEQRVGVARAPGPVAARPIPPSVPFPASPVPASPAKPATRPDLETTLGVRWLTALGTLVLVLGGAFFVVYFLGEALQILAGIAGGAALVAGGEALHRRARYGPYPYFLSGGGVVLAYFSVFAAYAFEDYRAAIGINLLGDALLLGVVALAGIALALRYDSRALAAEGFALGFVTSLLARAEASPGIEGLALLYVALLAGGLLAVVALRRWSDVGLAGAAGTWIVLAVLRPELTLSPWLYGGVVVLVAAELWALALRAEDALAPAAAAVASLGASVLLWWNAELASDGSGEHALWILSLLHVAAALALPRPVLRAVAGVAATALAFLWAPAAFDGWLVTVVWASLVAILAAAASRLALATPWLRVCAYAGAGLLAGRSILYDTTDFIADDPATLAAALSTWAATAALLAAYVLLGSDSARIPADERGLAARGLLFATVVSPLPWLYFRLGNWASVGWAGEGALLVAAGFVAARRDVRLAGIGILLLVVGRVLFVDSSVLDIGWRVVVFLAVGALVLGAAFLFARQRGRDVQR